VFKLGAQDRANNIGSIDVEMGSTDNIIVQLGISIEPVNIIQQQLSQKQQQPSSSSSVSTQDMAKFCIKMLDSLFNYALSFSKSSTPFGSPSLEAIPTEVFKKWHTNFEHKLQKDPNFWQEPK